MKHPNYHEPELSRPLSIDKIPTGGMFEHVVARPDERKALAQRFDLVELTSIEADLNADFVRAGQMVAVTGKMKADVIQACVITLEPIKSHIEEDISLMFAVEGFMKSEEEGGTLGDVDGEDIPEPIEDGFIDLGEVVSQQLAVSLNPYPRLEGAVIPALAPENQGKLGNALADLKEKLSKTKK